MSFSVSEPFLIISLKLWPSLVAEKANAGPPFFERLTRTVNVYYRSFGELSISSSALLNF